LSTKKTELHRVLKDTLKPYRIELDPAAASLIEKEIASFDKQRKFRNEAEKTKMTKLFALKAGYVAHEGGKDLVTPREVQDMFLRIPCPYPICSQKTLLRNPHVSAVVLKPTKELDHEAFKKGVRIQFSEFGIDGVDDLATYRARDLSKKLKVDGISARLMIRQAKVIASESG